MKQWFVGRFRGHYRGRPSAPSSLSPYPTSPHFRVEVYEAMVSEIELGPLISDAPPVSDTPPDADSDHDAEDPSVRLHKSIPAPTSPATAEGHHQPTGATLHQAHIGKVHLIDPVRSGQTFRSTAHDVLMSALSLSHPAESSRGTLGSIEGVMSGWYRPPPAEEMPEEVPAIEGPPPVGWRTEVLERDDASSRGADSSESSKNPPDLKPNAHPVHPRTRANTRDEPLLDDEVQDEDELDAVLSEETTSPEYPFFAIGLVITLLLGFLATPLAATLFGLTFLFSYALRKWLLGVVPDVSGIRVLSLFLGGCQILVAALLIARWSSLGCVALSPLPLIWLLGAQMASSLLPRPLPFALTIVGFAAVVLQAYATWAPPPCSASAEEISQTSTLGEESKKH